MKHTKIILIVDDDENVREALEFGLQNEGFRVESAVDGGQAVKLSNSRIYDLIITDMTMPKVGGYEFIRTLATNENRATPVIVISGAYSLESMESLLGMERNVKEMIVKPMNFDLLMLKVNSLLNTIPLDKENLRKKDHITESACDEFDPDDDNGVTSPMNFISLSVDNKSIRKDNRIAADIPVEISKAGTDVFEAQGGIFDFSVGGLGLYSAAEYDTGSELLIRINFSLISMDVHGKVTYRKKMKNKTFRYGIMYLKMEKDEKDQLKEAICKYKKLSEEK